MLPIAVTVFILIISIFTLIFGLLRAPEPKENNQDSKGMRGVVSLVLATLLGIFIIDQTNIVVGGTALVFLSSLAIGERKPSALAGMSFSALLLLLLVKWSGL
ncbi:hypothetical protein OO007_08760 [Cocleimonas sp. KMM 6892]|uniref:hypothetical protein n=1 Tax=unclassified Cocleimonas TaxID=2639732 RepID=UPI002DB97C5E|nr:MULTISPECIES: hypothetical protein [unclassified Cocleimonas]MEB8432318.1 hypothetical protein [Cocleimonas sp. KMM 6892]MEC4714596.1 hypothetical protein [Cocleimonas sp. KMM 6895]MEC4744590.1 hypothetical protein [Cocleimonas sp. KMM 6896]